MNPYLSGLYVTPPPHVATDSDPKAYKAAIEWFLFEYHQIAPSQPPPNPDGGGGFSGSWDREFETPPRE